ncbi:MAG: YdcF family protein [Oscillospiraceae bacterium]|nr:YdcF family protein [Oscillospiraceae bacterium]
MKKTSVIVNNCFLVFGILCIIFYLASGIRVRFGQSLLFLWPLMGLACIGRYILWKRAWKLGKKHPFPRWFLITERIVLSVCFVFFLFVESLMMSAALTPPPVGLDAVIVLGARVNDDGPSGALSQRIDAAAAYLRNNPNTIAIASGGQGDDEPMSEAQCIADHLILAGISPDRIILEDTSTSTVENLDNSFALLADKDVSNVGIVTNEFHVYRALNVGRALGGYDLYGVPAKSAIFGFVHYALREFFAIVVSWLRGSMAIA